MRECDIKYNKAVATLMILAMELRDNNCVCGGYKEELFEYVNRKLEELGECRVKKDADFA